MAYDIFRCFGLDKIKDSLVENFDYKDNDPSEWELVKTKSVIDSDGFITDYSWYKKGNKHIFMFGDTDLYPPDEDYSDFDTENEEEASDWFSSYKGFEDDSDPWTNFEEDDLDECAKGNSNFMNDGFDRVYGNGKKLEE